MKVEISTYHYLCIKKEEKSQPESQYSQITTVSIFLQYCSPPLSALSLSMVLVTHSQPHSKNIKWKIPEISNS